MYLVQILLPLLDNAHAPLPETLFRDVRTELTDSFGGLTAYSRAPAEGLWKEEPTDRPSRDEIVVYEVMTEQLDRAWWGAYRQRLEARFRQEQIVIRAQAMEKL